MDNKEAWVLYDDMLENYRNIMDDPRDIESADRLLDAVMSLCALGLPNPFRDEGQLNAAIRPTINDTLITGVYEKE